MRRKIIVSLLKLTVIVILVGPACSNVEPESSAGMDSSETVANSSDIIKINKPIPREPLTKRNFQPFAKYFSQIRAINLSEEVLLGRLTSLDVDKDGNLLTVDFLTKEIYIFDTMGRLKKKLSTEHCPQKIAWQPVAATFMAKGDIFVHNNSVYSGIILTNDGRCEIALTGKFWPLSFCIDADDKIYSFYAEEEKSYITKTDKQGKELANFGDFPKQFNNLISRHDGGGLICGNDFIYHALVSGPDVYVYNLDGDFINKLQRRVSYFKQIDSDLTPGRKDAGSLVAELKMVMKDKTATNSIFLLDKDKLMMQYVHNGRIVILDIFDLNGKSLVEEGIQADNIIALAKRGKIYVIKQAGLDKYITLPNPRIEIYQFMNN